MQHNQTRWFRGLGHHLLVGWVDWKDRLALKNGFAPYARLLTAETATYGTLTVHHDKAAAAAAAAAAEPCKILWEVQKCLGIACSDNAPSAYDSTPPVGWAAFAVHLPELALPGWGKHPTQ
ncbi:hypothetical protein THAOC_35787 [Thalassiosira oceanica]|uniref:Uncharacterized protein n=1 Tax=Thalassiosira oceanica TaxID=159749 RepID=K0R0D0_THAOC|nr:hypothetical protein THAOC_35787 [Thalassiosira oceanica]|eukprot:EJK45593.1 hypothetical protein THAOC_35787 [Thalassiosira oceanica]